ncbi:MAG TPA: MaoC family dehydratase [Chitinophagaceae bacterium]
MNKTIATTKTIKKFFEDFELNEGRTTGKRKITGADIDLHAEESGDYFPHHMDEEWCKTQPFKKRMAHGTLVLTAAIGLTADVINEVCMTYGFDRIRFVKPVFIDETILVVTKITAKKDHKRPGFGLITEQVETFNQNNELVMVCEHIYLVEKKIK